MNYTITYSNTKHGWVKLLPDMTLKITIPTKKSKDKNFENILLKKWIKLIEKYKTQNITKIETTTNDHVIIFWDEVDLNEINWDLELYLKEKLYIASLPILNEYSNKIWIKYNKLSIKDLKTKWWSCSWTQNISLNLKLIHLPMKFLEYVIIHEVCHLKEKHHQKKFWDLVGKYCNNYEETRKELKKLRF